MILEVPFNLVIYETIPIWSSILFYLIMLFSSPLSLLHTCDLHITLLSYTHTESPAVLFTHGLPNSPALKLSPAVLHHEGEQVAQISCGGSKPESV